MAGHDCLRMVQGSLMAGYRRQVAGVGIDFVEDIDFVAGVVEDIGFVAGVVEDSPGRMELAVVEVLDHRLVLVSHKGSAVAGAHCNSVGHHSRRLRNNRCPTF